MQIKHNNINFQALHASKRTLKKLQVTKTQLLQNQSVKDCAERAEVFVKSKRRFNSKKFDIDNVQSTLEIGGFLGTGAGLAGLTISGILMALGVVESSNSVDFGIEQKLKVLVDRLNAKKLKLGFIPPVQVKQLESTKKLMKR